MIGCKIYDHKTQLLQLDDAVKSMNRTGSQAAKYIAKKLNTKIIINTDFNEYCLLGEYNSTVIKPLFLDFIKDLILCNNCNNRNTFLKNKQICCNDCNFTTKIKNSPAVRAAI